MPKRNRTLARWGKRSWVRSSPVVLSLRQRDEQSVELLRNSIPRVFGILRDCEWDLRHRRAEFVFTKRLDRLPVGESWADDFEIEVGAMNYGFEIDGILGVNFLICAGAVVDRARMEIHPAP